MHRECRRWGAVRASIFEEETEGMAMKSMIQRSWGKRSRLELVIAAGALTILTVGACQLFQSVSDPPEASPPAGVVAPTVEEDGAEAAPAGGVAPADSTVIEELPAEPENVAADQAEPPAAPQAASFSMATASRSAPADVMDEVAVWVAGGGPGDPIPPGYKFVVDEGRAFLRGFAPNERVRLFAYEAGSYDYFVPRMDLLGWQEYQVDAAGNLEIQLDADIDEQGYIVIGDLTGEVRQFEGSGYIPDSILTSATRIRDFQICLQPCNGFNRVTEIPVGTTEIFIHWAYDNIPVGSSYSRTWSTYRGEWVRYECIWEGPESGAVDVSLREPGGLASTQWNVQIVVNGQQLLDAYVDVAGDWEYWEPAGTFYGC